ncbi:hypothetical protein NQ317_019497 [Molorchus minor]|uniref:Annexin n=1 Tax=Molorchus minor TaxID=1323400 RepID=A0ABQ9J9J2_9CUCU|nr:hypothetical protein NQ317_019497 [Molorchus minor]
MGRPTVVPYEGFNDEDDAKALKAAFKGFGSDEDAIIDIITRRSNEQRRQIATRFKTMYGKIKLRTLIKRTKKRTERNFEDLIIALMTEPTEFQAKQLHKAISGLGTDEKTIVEILAVHNNEDVIKIADEYEGLYQTSLEADIKGDTSGTLKRLLVSLSTGHRDESDVVNKDAAFQDAQDLLQAGELLFTGTDESVFNQVMCQRNRPQLRLVFEEYEKLVGHPNRNGDRKRILRNNKRSAFATNRMRKR